jgi:hypothetical protein
MVVWAALQDWNPYDAPESFGLFTNADKAKKACQDDVDAYYRETPQAFTWPTREVLQWNNNVAKHPAGGGSKFCVVERKVH